MHIKVLINLLKMVMVEIIVVTLNEIITLTYTIIY